MIHLLINLIHLFLLHFIDEKRKHRRWCELEEDTFPLVFSNDLNKQYFYRMFFFLFCFFKDIFMGRFDN